MNSITDGTKVLSITGSSEAPRNFINVEEREVESLKLKYYMWLSRLFILFAIVSLLVFMSSSLALFKLAPTINVEPFLIINQDQSEGIVRHEPITNDMASKELLMQTFVKQYVILRNTVVNDVREMYMRWLPGGMIHFLSAWPVYYQFQASSSKVLEELTQKDLVKEVEIISAGRLGGKRSPVWKVDFKTYEMTPGGTNTNGAMILRERNWTASVTSYFFPERIFMGRRLINPMGFTVTRYSQSEVEI